MTRRGFVYFDWNVSAHDDVADATIQQVLVSVVPSAKENYRSIILMHDSEKSPSTPQALPEMIDELRAAGLKFDVLSNHVSPVIFGYSD
jgi:peptidoglycan/xylan/chitin deacetylase (PgdA/CDA1 family)